MPKIHVSKSISINKPAAEIYPHLNNFRNWISWSPWLLMDPNCQLDFADDNQSYKWEGKRVGAGNMKVIQEKENKEIHYDLNFTKPWKSANKTSFYLQDKGDSTQVTWTMDSSLPLFMFWMKKAMIAYVGADYERGLQMLKSQAEKGEIESQLDWKGNVAFEGCHWVGIRKSCSIDDMKNNMGKDFGSLFEWIMNGNENLISGKAMSIYHKWDIVKNTTEYTAAVPVSKIPDNLPQNILTGEIPKTNAYVLRHTGDYNHLGNAWSTLYTMHRIKEIKPSKKLHPFEVYENDPRNTVSKDLITDIYFPLK